MFKKIILITTFFLSTNAFFAQSVFDKFDDVDGITKVSVTKKMFTLLSKIDDKSKDSQEYTNLIKKLDNLKVYSTKSDKKGDEMQATATKYIKTAGLEELMSVNDNGKNIKIYVKSGASESIVKELLMFIDGGNSGREDSVLMSLTGNFDLDEISALTEKMNLPGGDALKKASKKK